MEVSEPEVHMPNNELESMESSLTPGESYSISDFTIADTSAFDLDLSSQPDFADTYYLLDSITEESYEDSNPEEILPPIAEISDKEYGTVTKGETPVEYTVEEIRNRGYGSGSNIKTLVYDKEEGSITKIETPVDDKVEEVIIDKDGSGIKTDDRVEEVCVEVRIEQVKTFDLSKIANLVYSQEPIDGDPARPSPVHRTLDVGTDSDDDSCYFENVTIEEVVLSEGATYLVEQREFEGLSKVREVCVKEEVPVVENAFDFSVS